MERLYLDPLKQTYRQLKVVRHALSVNRERYLIHSEILRKRKFLMIDLKCKKNSRKIFLKIKRENSQNFSFKKFS